MISCAVSRPSDTFYQNSQPGLSWPRQCMSVVLSDPYQSFAIHYPSEHKPDDHGLIVFGSSQFQLRTKLMSGLPFPSENTLPSFGTHPQAVLPHPVSQSGGHNEPQSDYVTAHQMLPHQLPPHYGYEVATPQDSGSRKRSRSGTEEDIGRDVDRHIKLQPSLPPLFAVGSSVSAVEPPHLVPGS